MIRYSWHCQFICDFLLYVAKDFCHLHILSNDISMLISSIESMYVCMYAITYLYSTEKDKYVRMCVCV